MPARSMPGAFAQWKSEDERGRIHDCEQNRVISSDELDRRRFPARTAEARLAPARAAIQAGETKIARSRVTAPVDGEILKLNVRAGEFAAAGITPEPLLLLGGVEPMHLRVDVDEQEAWRVEPGAKAGEDRSHGVKVRRERPKTARSFVVSVK
jgi:HlyD family secretion protein